MNVSEKSPFTFSGRMKPQIVMRSGREPPEGGEKPVVIIA